MRSGAAQHRLQSDSGSAARISGAFPEMVLKLFENVRIFDGKAAALSAPSHILVRGNKIVRVSLSPIGVEDRVGATVIVGAGRTLMPGLIDAHAHMLMESFSKTSCHDA